MSASVVRFDFISHVTWQAHCNHGQASEQYLRTVEDWPRPTISLLEFNILCEEALQCLRQPKDTNALLEAVWVRLCYWLNIESSKLALPEIYELRTIAYLQAIGDLLEIRLCDHGQEDQRMMRLSLITVNCQTVTGNLYEI